MLLAQSEGRVLWILQASQEHLCSGQSCSSCSSSEIFVSFVLCTVCEVVDQLSRLLNASS